LIGGGKQAILGAVRNPQRAVVGFLLLGTLVALGGVLITGTIGGEDVSPEPAVAAGKGNQAAAPLRAAEMSVADGPGAPVAAASGETDGARLRLLPPEDPRIKERQIWEKFRPMAAWEVSAALAQVRALPDEDAREMAMLALLGEWSGKSVTELLRLGEVRRFGVAGALALHLMDAGKISPQEAVAMAGEFLGGREQQRLVGRAAERLAATDPAAALSLGDGLEGWAQVRFLENLAAGWAKTSPQEARAWAAQLPDAAARTAVMRRIVAEQARTSPAAAADLFAQELASDPQSQARTARQIGAAWAERDTVAALQWAGSLPDERARESALQGIRAVAPIGIGARIASSPEGTPVLQSLVPNGTASLSGQVRPGDRLLAVGDGRGGWVDTRAMEIGDVVGLVRGEPNTTVVMQVQSPGDAAPRVVTLNRQQVVHQQP